MKNQQLRQRRVHPSSWLSAHTFAIRLVWQMPGADIARALERAAIFVLIVVLIAGGEIGRTYLAGQKLVLS